MLLDVVLLFGSGILALLVRFDFRLANIDGHFLTRWMSFMPMELIVTILIFALFRMYSFVWHFVSVKDVAKMILGVLTAWTATFIAGMVFCLIWPGKFGVVGYMLPRSVQFMKLIFQLILLVGIRCGFRFIQIFKSDFYTASPERIMIIGAGDAGNLILREIQVNRGKYGKVCCMIDDNEAKNNKKINGVLIYGGRDKILEAAEKYKITQIIFAIPTASPEEKKEILDIAKDTGCRVKTIPGLYQLYSGQVQISEIKDVEIEDLLGREPVSLDKENVKKFIQNKVVMVTGGGGSIGSEIARQVAANVPKQLILLDIYENNVYDVQQELSRRYGSDLNLKVIIASVRDKNRIDEIFDEYRPEVVFHAAAHKHVPLMEDAPSEAVKNNIFGTYHVVRACEKFGVSKFIMISTDKAVNPTSVMGATKRFCEMVVQSRAIAAENIREKAKTDPEVAIPVTEFASVRFGNVLGSNGSVVPLFKRQIEEGGPVTVTDKRITRFFMTIPEAAQLVLEAGAIAAQNQIFVLDMGEPVKIIDLAENLIKLSGLNPYVDIDIKEIGLRPGEKLYEELLMKSENLTSTENKKIFIEEQAPIDPETIMKDLIRLDEAVSEDEPDEDKIRDLLKEMIPTYKTE